MHLILKSLLLLFATNNLNAVIIRNNALITKMVSKFQGKDSLQEKEQDTVVTMMQKVLCKNFPSIPCKIITQDETLRQLIEKSIQQLKYKKMSMEKTTAPPKYSQTKFPVINSEDLSMFLQLRDPVQKRTNRHKNKKHRTVTPSSLFWNQESTSITQNNTKKSRVNGHKKIRKFYPHKVKYKDKRGKDLLDESDDKLSMSSEVPDTGVRRRQFNYRNPEPPIWRIDYMKHGEPSFFEYESDLKGKIMKSGPNVIVDKNMDPDRPRKDVMHTDVFIKRNNFNRKYNLDNSEQK